MTGMILSARGVRKTFGGVVALDGLDLDIAPGIVHAVIGPNGSGKTTLLNTLSGAYVPDAGTITLVGHQIAGMKPHRIARIGLARTFQNIRLFTHLTVRENIAVAAARQTSVGLWKIISGSRAHEAAETEIDARAMAALELVGLSGLADSAVSSLPYAHQRLVEIARAVVSEPTLLLLDEPAAGMTTREGLGLLGIIDSLRKRGFTIVLVEHNVRLVMEVSDRITVLDFGRKVAEGTPAEVQKDPAVIEAYLGRRKRDA